MPLQTLRIAAFSAYLAAWLVLGLAALANALSRKAKSAEGLTPPVLLGTLLQALAPLLITLKISTAPLRPHPAELITILLLAPLAAALFTWALRSAPKTANTLVTTGAYRWLRHPIYLAFFAMLLATGLLLSARLPLLAAAILYLAGSELRIAVEEEELTERFPAAYPLYQQRTPWRYLPGLR
jgi:protein-S-isoprenylcysteine O-methyltransferase Ste14